LHGKGYLFGFGTKISHFLLFFLTLGFGKDFSSPFSLLPRLYLSSPLHQSSKTYSSQRLSLCYGTSKFYEQVKASIELILPTLSSQGKNHEIRVLVKEVLGWNRNEQTRIMMS
jgi:hypothetical protein